MYTHDTLWTSEDAVKATDGKASGSFAATGLSIDTRKLQKGDLYVALKGDTHDGHDFLDKAIAAGAVAAIVSREPEEAPAIPLLVVKDTLKALEAMAAFRRKQSNAKIIGVTGSVGKTSVKNMLAFALAEQGRTHSSGGNLNNHIGLPLSLARMPADVAFGVFELGMNHAGEIRALTKLLRPHVAVITGIEAVHLEFFSSLADIAEAKAEIFEGVEQGGGAVVPYDTDFLPLLAGRAHQHGIAIDNIISFGIGEHAAYKLLKGKETIRFQDLKVRVKDEELIYRLGLVGRHQALNSLAVLAAVNLAGADVKRAASSFVKIRPSEGRGRLYAIACGGKGAMLLDDSYNASPASMRASFAVLKLAQGRKVAALGDMLELGKDEATLHAELAEDIEKRGIDLVFTAGTRMANLHKALPSAIRGVHVESSLELLPVLKEQVQEGDTLLVKGSHGSLMFKLAEALRKGR